MGVINKVKSEKLKVKSYGFTLIETIVVVTIIGLVLPTIFAIVFTVLREQTKVYRLTTVKREGDYALNTISNLIRNDAFSIHSSLPAATANQVCKTLETFSSSTGLYFLNDSNQWFGFEFSDNKLSSSSATLSSYLNSNNTIVDNFSIGCQKTADYSSPVVNLSFDICFKTSSGNCNSTRPEETANLSYQTRIKLRNF